jgi:TDG/mug DNA glycosylase family protein
MRKSGLPPVVGEDTEILIMGTLPGDKSLADGKYYADSSNDFWKLVGGALNQNLVGSTYQEKIRCLKANRIGLWDAFHASFRPGSMDKDIAEKESNDFAVLKRIAPNIRLICFNGGEAAEAKESLTRLKYQTLLLPSSSGANRKNQVGRLSDWEEAIQSITPDIKKKYGLSPEPVLDDADVLSPSTKTNAITESIFHKLVAKENSYTQLLCNLMKRDEGFCRTLLTLFAGENPRMPFGDLIISPQKGLRDDCGQPDLLIEAPTLCIIVEVKTESHTARTPRQKLFGTDRSYLSYLKDKHHSGVETAFTFLVPHNWVFKEEMNDEIATFHEEGKWEKLTVTQVFWEQV